MYIGSLQYQGDNYHFSASSSQLSACSFEPANAQDVGIAVRLIGWRILARHSNSYNQLQILSKDQTPFAVKSGGYAMVSGFSSTPGVQIAMDLFSDIVYDAGSQTATVGLGLIWDDVYSELQNYGVTVIGGKFHGIGVGGVILGAGKFFSIVERCW